MFPEVIVHFKTLFEQYLTSNCPSLYNKFVPARQSWRKKRVLQNIWLYLSLRFINVMSSIMYADEFRNYVTHALRILTGKKHPKIKLQRLRKIRIWTSGLLVHQINFF